MDASTRLVQVALLVAIVSAHAAPAQSTGATIAHVWKPVRDGGAEVEAIEVRTELRRFPATAGAHFSLKVPITYAGVAGIAGRTESLHVRDRKGEIALTVDDDAVDPSGFPFFRHYRAQRAVTFPLTVTYRAAAPHTPLHGPPFGLFAAYGGVSGAGSGFLVLPEYDRPVANTVHWDLSDLAPGATAATTFADGDFTIVGRPARLRQGWIMAGPLGRYPDSGTMHGFSAIWLGTPSWDADSEMTWAARMYEWLGRSYAYLRPLPPYTVFIRVGGPPAGTALGNSFMGFARPRAAGAAPEGESARETFTHEMGHLFVGGIAEPDRISSWFSEGLNVYYTRLLPMRGGFTSVDDYGKSLNDTFREYWYGEARNLSVDSIARIGFNDEAVRHMPYVRGSLYFADLDSKIRAHSGGRRNLDVVIRELFVGRLHGVHITHASWEKTVEREAGPGARDDFEHIILAGDRTLVPASDAFGPCLERRDVPAMLFNGRERAAGYEWVRVAGIPDSTCRAGYHR